MTNERARLIYDKHDELTGRHALVFQSQAIPHLPFQTRFYEGVEFDHMRRFSTSGMATSAADEWCNQT